MAPLAPEPPELERTETPPGNATSDDTTQPFVNTTTLPGENATSDDATQKQPKLKVELAVDAAEVMALPYETRTTYYEVSVTEIDGSTRTIRKRYKDFEELHSNLSMIRGIQSLPAMPQKSFFRKTFSPNGALMASRKKDLADILVFASSHTEAQPALRDFVYRLQDFSLSQATLRSSMASMQEVSMMQDDYDIGATTLTPNAEAISGSPVATFSAEPKVPSVSTSTFGAAPKAPSVTPGLAASPNALPPQVYMVCVAIDYKVASGELTCTRDGRNMMDLWRACGQPQQNVIQLFCNDGDKDQMTRAVQDLGSRCNPGDFFIFYYAGQVGLSASFADFMSGNISNDVKCIVLSDSCQSGAIADFDSTDAWGELVAVAMSGCVDDKRSCDIGVRGYFTHSLLMAIEDFCRKGRTSYSVHQLYNSMLELSDPIEARRHDIKCSKSNAMKAESDMTWPLVPPDDYTAPGQESRSNIDESGEEMGSSSVENVRAKKAVTENDGGKQIEASTKSSPQRSAWLGVGCCHRRI